VDAIVLFALNYCMCCL